MPSEPCFTGEFWTKKDAGFSELRRREFYIS
jgi:hypothetical protein